MDIDFGDVSMNMRALLRSMGKKSFNAGTTAAMFFLNAKNPATINATRQAMIGAGFKVQRAAHDLLSGFARKQTAKPPATVGKAPMIEQVVHFINKKMPGGLPKQSAQRAHELTKLEVRQRTYRPTKPVRFSAIERYLLPSSTMQKACTSTDRTPNTLMNPRHT